MKAVSTAQFHHRRRENYCQQSCLSADDAKTGTFKQRGSFTKKCIDNDTYIEN